MAINEDRRLGRAKNAVLSFLERRLSVPKIYMDADWNGNSVDVLAIDRDGVGDVHVVLLFTRRYPLDGRSDTVSEAHAEAAIIDQLAAVPAQYKYMAAIEDELVQRNRQIRPSETTLEKSFSPDGIGRIGFLRVQVPEDTDASVSVDLKAERFRAKIASLADEYIQHHEADWEIRA